MKTTIITVIICLFSFIAHSQTLDSLKYPYGNLYYHEYGNKSAEPIIILSGGPGSSYDREENVAIELGNKYRTILLEQRGTGRSIPTPFDSTTINLKGVLDDLNLLMKHLNLNKAIIYGHSWGGMYAMAFAAYCPEKVKSLILLGTGPYKDNWEIRYAEMQIGTTRYGVEDVKKRDALSAKINSGIATASDSLELKKFGTLGNIYDKTKIDTIYDQLNKGKGKANNKTKDLMNQDLINTNFDLSKKLSDYKGSIHAICGREDRLALHTYDLKILRPSVQLHWIEECGHYPMFEQPKAFYDELFKIIETIK